MLALLPRFDHLAPRVIELYASQVTNVTLLGVILNQADKLIVSRLLPLGGFGIYTFTSNALNRGLLLTGAVAQAVFPSLPELHSAGKRQGVLDQYWRLQDLLSYVTVVVFAAAPASK